MRVRDLGAVLEWLWRRGARFVQLFVNLQRSAIGEKVTAAAAELIAADFIYQGQRVLGNAVDGGGQVVGFVTFSRCLGPVSVHVTLEEPGLTETASANPTTVILGATVNLHVGFQEQRLWEGLPTNDAGAAASVSLAAVLHHIGIAQFSLGSLSPHLPVDSGRLFRFGVHRLGDLWTFALLFRRLCIPVAEILVEQSQFVAPDVGLQAALLSRPVLAVRTLVRLLLRVPPHVLGQGAEERKGAAAHAAGVARDGAFFSLCFYRSSRLWRRVLSFLCLHHLPAEEVLK